MAQRHAQPPLTLLSLRPSPRLAFLIAAMHLAAAASFAPLDISPWLKLVPLPLIVGSAWITLRRYALLLSADAIIGIHSLPEGLLECVQRNGVSQRLRVLPHSSIFESVVVVLLTPEAGGRTRSVVVFRDALDADEMRRLRVWLRWQPIEAGGGAS